MVEFCLSSASKFLPCGGTDFLDIKSGGILTVNLLTDIKTLEVSSFKHHS